MVWCALGEGAELSLQSGDEISWYRSVDVYEPGKLLRRLSGHRGERDRAEESKLHLRRGWGVAWRGAALPPLLPRLLLLLLLLLGVPR